MQHRRYSFVPSALAAVLLALAVACSKAPGAPSGLACASPSRPATTGPAG
jgi:hypothetical protein